MWWSIGAGLLGGAVILAIGAESLVRGAARLATALGISPLVIGLTVVSFATSAPELVVSMDAALLGESDVAAGNVIGSNILNTLLILGLSALVTPLVVAKRLVRFDVWVMIGVSLLVYGLGRDGRIGRPDGLLLSAGIFAYVACMVHGARREKNAVLKLEYAAHIAHKEVKSGSGYLLNGFLVLVGLGLLVLGARIFVASAVNLARSLDVRELIIGLTIVAMGTSLPEIAASVVASYRGERDIAVGNVVGSNVFNLLGVLGFSSVAGREGIAMSEALLRFDMPVMIGAALACLPVFLTGYVISRWEGLLFLGYYLAYVVYVILSAQRHDALRTFQTAMLWHVIPLTLLAMLIGSVRALRAQRACRRSDVAADRAPT